MRSAAVVTGAARGIGLAVADRLLDEGHPVALLDVDARALEAAAAARQGRRGMFHAVCDVGDARSVTDAVARARAELGEIAILVNSAGVGGPFHRVDEVSDSEWRQVFTTNAFGTFLTCRTLLPSMKRGGFGRIVNIASVQGHLGAELSSTYSASKHAVVGYTRSLAAEWGPFGITCNAVSPGYVDTRMGVQEDARPGHRSEVLAAIPMGRLARPAEVAAAVAYLCGPDAGYVNGACLVIDGGLTATQAR